MSDEPTSTLTGFDLVISGGRVIDPETGLDAVRNVGIRGDRIDAVSTQPLDGTRVIDASGLVVAPGFVDLHSHGQDVAELRLQAMDGVTSAFELEGGAAPVAMAYARAEQEGRPINFGFSASWAAVRQQVLDGAPPTGMLKTIHQYYGAPGWLSRGTPAESDRIVECLGRELEAGGLGIGLLLGYSPRSSTDEYVKVAALAAQAGAPTFTHARPLVEQDSTVLIDGANEIARAAALTGAHMHFCHIAATSGRYLDRVLDVVDKAKSEGSRISTEAYPYGAGWSRVSADYFHPSRLHVLGLKVTDLTYVRTGEVIETEERLLELRADDPTAPVYINYYDEEVSAYRMAHTIALPDSCIASDAIPFVPLVGSDYDPWEWPVPQHVKAHPRNGGTYGRTLRVARETGVMTLLETVAKCSLYPARVLQEVAPRMRWKGRLQERCDAEIVVFDPEEVTDQSTLSNPIAVSRGFLHVVVNGVPIVTDSRLDTNVMPGRAVKGSPR